MSLIDIATNNELRLALLAGVAASSYYLCANVGTAYFGIIPAILDPKSPLPVSSRLTLWKDYYDLGKVSLANLIHLC